MITIIINPQVYVFIEGSKQFIKPVKDLGKDGFTIISITPILGFAAIFS